MTMTMLPECVTTVLFDVGNTLHHLDHEFIAAVINSHGSTVTARRVAEAEYIAKAMVDEEVRGKRLGRTDATRQLPYYEVIMDELGVEPDRREAIGVELREENRRDSLWRVLHPQTPDVLKQLSQRGYTLGVISNADGRVPAALAASGIAPLFTAILDSHIVGVEKPDPRIFQMALEQCGAQPAESLYIGDIYEIDVVGSRAAGLTGVLLDPLGLYGRVDCIRIDSLARLLELLPVSAR